MLSSCDNFLRWLGILTTSIRDIEVIAVWRKIKKKVEDVDAMPTCRWFKFTAFLDRISEGCVQALERTIGFSLHLAYVRLQRGILGRHVSE